MNKNIILVLLTIGLLFLMGCQGDQGGLSASPFLGGTTGVYIEFEEGSPPEEVTDDGSYEFDALVSLRNDGEYDIDKDDIEVNLYGINPEDFGSFLEELTEQSPSENVNGRRRDTEGNIIEGTPIYVRFPPNDEDSLSYVSDLVGDRKDFRFRANVCYRYQTLAMAQYCVLRDLINVRDNAVCDPTATKSVFSSGAPIQVANFRQTVAGQDKIGFSFDIVHRGNGYVFEYGEADSPAATCPSDPSLRRRNEDRIKVTVEPGLGAITCSGLESGVGFVKLSQGIRPVFCTLTLSPDRSDFEKELRITLDYNYEDDRDKIILVKHLAE